MLISTILLYASAASSAAIAPAHSKTAAAAKPENSSVPPKLTMKSFDEALSHKLLLVEFFSPFCHHCTALAPEWAAAHAEVSTTYASLNVNMFQVDCVALADLCNKQDILYYPQIRLYIPNTDSPEKVSHKFVGTLPLSIKQTRENLVKYVRNVADEYESGELDNTISSSAFSTREMQTIIEGKAKQLHFIAYFYATDEEWTLSVTETDLTKNPFRKSCSDCLPGRLAWGRVLNQVSAQAAVGHVNCRSHPQICAQAGVFQTKAKRHLPVFLAYLPKETGVASIPYRGQLYVRDMHRFITRIATNSRYPRTSMTSIKANMKYIQDLSDAPEKTQYPLQNKVSVVYYHKDDKPSPKDVTVMQQLLREVLQSPFEVSLFASRDENLVKDMAVRARNMIARIPKDAHGRKPDFDQRLYDATTFSNAPAVLIYHDSSLINAVYQHVDPDHLDTALLHAFMRANTFPLIQELTPDMLAHYFNTSRSEQHKKVVVTFLNSSAASLPRDIAKLRLAATQYQALSQAQAWEKATTASPSLALVDFAKGDATSNMVAEKMRREMPQLYHHDQALFTFIDIGKFSQFNKLKGWKGFLAGVKCGHTLVLSKDSRYMWDTDAQGRQLTSDPLLVAPLLVQLSSGEKHGIQRKVVNSPFGNVFPILDTIHDYGKWGYLGVFTLLYGLYRLILLQVLRRSRRKYDSSAGLLGNINLPKTD